MMSNNKILTVSYGTFSCTLEGFENSFGTMKAITEYFRDLSAANPYFGSEPLQPDADMLARIAQNEIARKVSAQHTDDGVHLRAAQIAPSAPPAVVATAAVTQSDPAPTPQTEEAPEPTAEMPDTVQLADLPDNAEEMGDTISAVLADVSVADTSAHETDEASASVEQDDAAMHAAIAAVSDAPDEEATQPADMHADIADAPEAMPEDDSDALLESILDDSVSDSVDAEDVSAFMELGEDNAEIPDEAAASEEIPGSNNSFAPAALAAGAAGVAAAAGGSSIADKLQRIRQVVAQNQSGASDYLEDEHADPTRLDEHEPTGEVLDELAPSEDTLTDEAGDEDVSLDAIADQIAEDQTPLPTPEAATEQVAEAFASEVDFAPLSEEDPDDVSAILGRMSEDLDLNTELSPEDTAKPGTADDIIESTSLDAPESAPSNERSDFAADVEALQIDDLVDSFGAGEDDVTAQDDLASDIHAALADDSFLAEDAFDDSSELTGVTPDQQPELGDPQDEAATPPVQPKRVARVIKVKRADLEAAIDSGMLEEVDDGGAAESSLSDEDEADLMRELAAVEAEMGGDLEVAPAAGSGNTILDELGTEDNEALDRLMAEADSQMDEPESSSRRNAFDRLRAAVAATKADEELGDGDTGAEEDAYRTDLADAVRPRRPASADADADVPARSRRPERGRAAPLKLVAEQRIDTNTPKRGPVRPRRIAAAELAPAPNPESGSGTFADFAEEQGAVALGDVLEAAASYLSFVEGHEQFSRPQLMTKVRQLEIDGFTREDGLRHFGQLLRSGKIEKIKGGRFTVSDGIGFRPTGHRATG